MVCPFCFSNNRKFKNVELVVSKCYHASGIITITIIFQVIFKKPAHTMHTCFSSIVPITCYVWLFPLHVFTHSDLSVSVSRGTVHSLCDCTGESGRKPSAGLALSRCFWQRARVSTGGLPRGPAQLAHAEKGVHLADCRSARKGASCCIEFITG